MEYQEKVRDRLIKLRKSKFSNMEDFAKLLGMSKEGYRMVESQGWPNLKRITQIAELLEVDIEYFYQEEKPQSIQELSQEIVDLGNKIKELESASMKHLEVTEELAKFEKLKRIEPKQYDSMLFLATRLINEYIEEDEEKEMA